MEVRGPGSGHLHGRGRDQQVNGSGKQNFSPKPKKGPNDGEGCFGR